MQHRVLKIPSEFFLGIPYKTVNTWLQEEEHNVIQYLSQIRTRRNQFAPFNRLPKEILIWIFQYTLPYSEEFALYHRSLENLTHICRQWRELVMQHPKFWSKIYTFSFPFGSRAKHYFQLSKGSPVELVVNYTNSHLSYHSNLQCLEDILPCLGSLTFNIRNHGLASIFLDKVSNMEPSIPSNSLQIIKLNNCSKGVHVFNLSERLRPQNAICLRAVKIPFSNPAWSNLVKIELMKMDSTAFGSDPPYTIHDFLDVLERCPDLEILRVLDCFIHGHEPCPSRIVLLPRLRSFVMKNPVKVISAFTKHIVIPSSSDVTFHPTGIAKFYQFDFRSNIPAFQLSHIPILQSVKRISLAYLTDPNKLAVILSGTQPKTLSAAGGSFKLVVECTKEIFTPTDGIPSPSFTRARIQNTILRRQCQRYSRTRCQMFENSAFPGTSSSLQQRIGLVS
ncbi:hypothetical protein ABKN59_005208 [Abortiporus biennis]